MKPSISHHLSAQQTDAAPQAPEPSAREKIYRILHQKRQITLAFYLRIDVVRLQL